MDIRVLKASCNDQVGLMISETNRRINSIHNGKIFAFDNLHRCYIRMMFDNLYQKYQFEVDKDHDEIKSNTNL